MIRGWLVVALVCACGGKSSAPDGGAQLAEPDGAAKSGTRLKLRRYDIGGVRALSGVIVDSGRGGELCLSRTWDDGKTYCTPDARRVVYLDSNCTQPAVEDPPDACLAGSYAASEDGLACAVSISHLYGIGTPIAARQYYERQSATQCSGPFDGPLRALTAEVPRSALVELTTETAPAAGRIARTFRTSADGYKEPQGFRDTELDATCFVQNASGAASGACIPVEQTFASGFADEACQTPIATPISSCSTPRFVLRPSEAACPTDPSRLYQLGAQVTPAAVYVHDTGATCTATTPGAAPYYALGAEVTAAAFTRGHDGSGAVQPVALSDGASRFTTSALYDTARATECFVSQLGDGAHRCISFGLTVQDAFSDDHCTQPIRLVSRARVAPSCTPPPLPRRALKEVASPPGVCGLTLELYDIGAPYTGPVFLASGVCEADTRDREYYLAGDAHPLSDLPTATVVVDP